MHGVSWETVGLISGIVTAWLTVVLTVVVLFLARRDKRLADQNTQIKNEISDAVNHLSEVLLAKLETKETVSQISVRLARLEGAAGAAPNATHIN